MVSFQVVDKDHVAKLKLEEKCLQEMARATVDEQVGRTDFANAVERSSVVFATTQVFWRRPLAVALSKTPAIGRLLQLTPQMRRHPQTCFYDLHDYPMFDL